MNTNFAKSASALLLGSTMAALLALTATAADETKPEDRQIKLADGKLTLTAPQGWERRQPKVNFIEHEFGVPAAEGDEQGGRLTVMGAGGDIESNIARWQGQFSQPGGNATSAATKLEKKKVGGADVHLVDITGTYKDSPGGPFAGAKSIDREDYRMLGAIIATEGEGNYFFKFYGPEKTVGAHEKEFRAMIDDLKTN